MSGTKYSAADATMLPLPPGLAPLDLVNLNAVSREDILGMPPVILMHMLRTGSQMGLQIIGPRQTTLNGGTVPVHAKTSTATSAPFTGKAGSDAAQYRVWRTLPGSPPINEDLIPGMPGSKIGPPLSIRKPTAAASLLPSDTSAMGPAAKGLLCAKRLVEVQAYEDVNGEAEAVAEVLEAVWGLDPGVLSPFAEKVTSMPIDLSSHALGCDTAFPVLLAPIQDRRVLSVAMGPGAAESLGTNRRINWTRARVGMEAKFYVTATVEGHSLVALSHGASRLVGDSSMPINDPLVISYQMRGPFAWYSGSETFALTGVGSITRRQGPAIMTLMNGKMTSVASITAGALAKVLGRQAVWVWHAANVPTLSVGTGNVLLSMVSRIATSSYSLMTTSRDPAAQIANAIATALATMPAGLSYGFSRYMFMLRAEAQRLTIAWDPALARLAAGHLTRVTQHLNMEMTAAAARRGKTSAEFFSAYAARASGDLRIGGPTTASWAAVAVHYFLRGDGGPVAAVIARESHMGVGEYDHIKLAAVSIAPLGEPGSWDDLDYRLREYRGAWRKFATQSYAGDVKVASTVERYYAAMNEPTLAETVERYAAAKAMHVYRWRATETLNISTTPDAASALAAAKHRHARVREMRDVNGLARHVVVSLAPYSAYTALMGARASNSVLAEALGACEDTYVSGTAADAFEVAFGVAVEMDGRILAPLFDPSVYARKVENTVDDAFNDILDICARTCAKAQATSSVALQAPTSGVLSALFAVERSTSAAAAVHAMSGYAILARMPAAVRVGYVDSLEERSEADGDNYLEKIWPSVQSFENFASEVMGPASRVAVQNPFLASSD